MALASASLFKDERATLERVEKFVSPLYFTDSNLRGQLYGPTLHIQNLLHADFGMQRVGFEAARQALQTGQAVTEGFSFGPTWSTHWFKLPVVLPADWIGKRVHVRWTTGCEAMIWSDQGAPLQAISDERDFCLSSSLTESQLESTFYVECAANGLFGAGKGDMIAAPDPEKYFTLSQAQVSVFNWSVYQLLMDLDVIYGVAKELPPNSHHRFKALYVANAIVNACVPTDEDAISKCRQIAAEFLSQGGPKGRFGLKAVGNCHIDSAWLWPYAETRRKCARSWSSTLALMEDYEQLIFAVSQAQQIAWLRDDYPSLFAQIQQRAKEGRFVPVGGCWVEMDGYLPSGESFVRQMLYGQQFFLETFGCYCTEFWLPDTFGYSAQLPQITKLAGMPRFVTQKISWNFVNKFPHNTFLWEGIDGSKTLSHFPSTDYVSRVTVEECVRTHNNFSDKGRSNSSLILYGFGDGGGGPSAEMCERLARLGDINELPTVTHATPAQFFEELESKNEVSNLCTWSGELFLELHNGTYTTQADTKQLNRECEFVLRDAELAAAVAWLCTTGKHTRTYTDEWKKVLLNQFHDVLPGSSIAQVYVDAKELYDEVLASCLNANGTIRTGLENGADKETYLLNSLPWVRICAIDSVLYQVPGFSIVPQSLSFFAPTTPATVSETAPGTFVLQNKYIRAQMDSLGRVSSLTMVSDQLTVKQKALYEAVAPGQLGAQFVLFDDVPLYWDAWDTMDYHLETGKLLETAEKKCKITKDSGQVAELTVLLAISQQSHIHLCVRLGAETPYLEFEATVDWHESHKFLKVQFPSNLRSETATYEIQFGHIQRPTHRNTSWDAAKYEVCGHKWACLSEDNFGVAVLNDSKYGYSCFDGTLTLSLLRSPKAPDADADMGKHKMRYALMPFTGTFQRPKNFNKSVIQFAYEFNLPLRKLDAWNLGQMTEFCKVSESGVIIESVKLSEDKSGLIVRLYESFGGKAAAWIQFSAIFPIKEVFVCDLLERKQNSLQISVVDNSVGYNFRPFEILSLFVLF